MRRKCKGITMQTIYGVILSDGTHCDTSATEQGAKNYATRNGYREVSARYNGGYAAVIVAHRDGGRWKPGPLPFVITKPGDYVTRAGDRVTVDAIVTQNGAGQNATFPIKGRIWKMYRGEVRPREFKVWQSNGLFYPLRESQWDIVGAWIGGAHG